MEHVIHWSLTSVQVMALVDPGAECSLVHGKPRDSFLYSTYINCWGAQTTEVEAVSFTRNWAFLCEYTLYAKWPQSVSGSV